MKSVRSVAADRVDLARTLKKHPGIRKIVEDQYPDRAHFIFELLQNAEDVKAKTAEFVLHRDKVVFEHDGATFTEDNVRGITNIGEGTKPEGGDEIGRFGVGFKAVFAYTESPAIWSPSFCFSISDFVYPTDIAPLQGLTNKTRFSFPFNNSKKPSAVAYEEICATLDKLPALSLLFLRHIKEIRWRIESGPQLSLVRIQHSAEHIEVRKLSADRKIGVDHYLLFKEPVENLSKHDVAVAYELEPLDGRGPSIDSTLPLHKQLRVNVETDGKVAIYFPAASANSGLRFHVHAPFIPIPSRSDVKNCPANADLVRQIAKLAARSLRSLRELKFLTSDFLYCIPLPQDQLGNYFPIREEMLMGLQQEELTPTHSHGYAPAKHLCQARASFKELISEDDLNLLRAPLPSRIRWATNSTLRNDRKDKLLEALGVRDWDARALAGVLQKRLGHAADAAVSAWLESKSVAWLQKLFIELNQGDVDGGDLSEIACVPLYGGSLIAPNRCYFPDKAHLPEDELPRVDHKVFDGKPYVRQYLAEMGVREADEAAKVELILARRYRGDDVRVAEQVHYRDLKQFVRLVESEPQHAVLFKNARVLRSAEGKFEPGQHLFLDDPFQPTGLREFHAMVPLAHKRTGISDTYEKSGIELTEIARFATAIGASSALKIEECSCKDNTEYGRLCREDRGIRSGRGIDTDYTIHGIDEVLCQPTLDLSRLIWATLIEQESDFWTTAVFAKGGGSKPQRVPSQLAVKLRQAQWVPQKGGRFVAPCEATVDALPPKFTYDEDWHWLTAIGFGQSHRKRTESAMHEAALAQELGFDDLEALARAREFAKLPKDEQQQILSRFRAASLPMPNEEPANPGQRELRAYDEAMEAQPRTGVEVQRTIQVGVAEVKQAAKQFLHQQYTDEDGHMRCQVCKRQELLPFKRPDGTEYFEVVQFLDRHATDSRYPQNYLALCPNHAAMFMYANGSRDQLYAALGKIDASRRLPVLLAGRDVTIYFTSKHLIDLKAAARAEIEKNSGQ